MFSYPVYPYLILSLSYNLSCISATICCNEIIKNKEFNLNLGERIKQIRKARGLSAESIAKELGVSVSTVYRYEDSSIEKIPVGIFNKLCTILDVSPSELMNGNLSNNDCEPSLPNDFDNPQDAMAFILKLPTLAAYGGYNIDSMDDETIINFANDLLDQLKMVSYKYK